MRAFSFLVFAVPLLAVAAPVPKEKLTGEERLEKYWGAAALPDKGCTAEPTDDRVVLATPGGFRAKLFDADETKLGPRTARTVSGDFDAQVKLVRMTVPDADAPKSGELCVTCGLYAAGEGRMTRKGQTPYAWTGWRHQAAHTDPRRQPSFGRIFWFDTTELGLGGGDATGSDGVWVRLSRRGTKWTCGRSADGARWEKPLTQEWDLPDDTGDVVVGVFVAHEVDQNCEAEFAAFQVSKPTETTKK